MGVTLLGYLSLFLGFVVQCVYSFGAFKGHRWAFGLVALVTAQEIIGYIQGIHGQGSIRSSNVPWGFQAIMAYLILVFLYCGLRLVGPLGPQFGKLLPARDEARFLDEPDSPNPPSHSKR